MATEYVPKGTTDLSAYGSDSNIVVFAEGNQTVTAGLDKSGLTNGWTGLYLQAGFTGTIGGGSSGPLLVDVDVSPGLVINAALGGELNIKPGGASSAITKLQHIGPARTNIMSGGTVTNVEQTAGRVNITSDVTVTNLVVNGGICTQQYKASDNTTLIVAGGQLTSGRGFTNAYVGPGSTAIFRREDTSATLRTGGTLYILGGTVVWQGGNITTVHLYGRDAMLDLSKAPSDLTITTVNGTADALSRSGILTASLGTFKTTIGATITTTTVNVYAGNVAFRGYEGGQTFQM